MKKALTLLEVIVALGIMAGAILLGLELLGKIVRADAQLRDRSTLEERVYTVRKAIEETPWDVAVENLESGTWEPLAGVRVQKSEETLGVEETMALALLVRLNDSAGENVMEFGMIKLKDEY